MTKRGRGRPRREDYLTTTRAAAYATAAGHPLSYKTIARLFDAKILKGHRSPGGPRRILRDSLTRYLATTLDSTESTIVCFYQK